MNDNKNNIHSLMDIMNIKSIVIVDDARTVSEEDAAEIRKSLERKENEEDDFSDDNN